MGIIPTPRTLGENIRNVRLKKRLHQKDIGKLFGIDSVNISLWELNRQPPQPKHLESILAFLGFTPKLKSNFDKLGSRTKLWRIQHSILFDEFLRMIDIPKEEILKIEQARNYKVDKKVTLKINRFLKENTTFSFELIS